MSGLFSLMPESSTPTKERLALALEAAGFAILAARARTGEFSDFESPHAMSKVTLVHALRQEGPTGKTLAQRVIAGEFDDTEEESRTWWEREGKQLWEDLQR